MEYFLKTIVESEHISVNHTTKCFSVFCNYFLLNKSPCNLNAEKERSPLHLPSADHSRITSYINDRKLLFFFFILSVPRIKVQ